MSVEEDEEGIQQDYQHIPGLLGIPPKRQIVVSAGQMHQRTMISTEEEDTAIESMKTRTHKGHISHNNHNNKLQLQISGTADTNNRFSKTHAPRSVRGPTPHENNTRKAPSQFHRHERNPIMTPQTHSKSNPHIGRNNIPKKPVQNKNINNLIRQQNPLRTLLQHAKNKRQQQQQQASQQKVNEKPLPKHRSSAVMKVSRREYKVEDVIKVLNYQQDDYTNKLISFPNQQTNSHNLTILQIPKARIVLAQKRAVISEGDIPFRFR